MRPDLRRLVPSHKSDLAAADAAVAFGWPAVEPISAQLLEWVQDMNWPVAHLLAPLLSSAGAELASQVLRVLRTQDETWKYFVIQSVVAPSGSLCRALEAELRRIAEHPMDAERHEEVDLVAREALELLL